MQNTQPKNAAISTQAVIEARTRWYMLSLFSRNKNGERRLSPSRFKFLLMTHILVSGAWLGAALAKFVLGLAAVTTDDHTLAAALLTAMPALTIAYPILSSATALTGVLLALGTKWGLIEHYWIAVKIALSITVVLTASVLTDGLLAGLNPALTVQATSDGTLLKISATSTLLLLSLCLIDVLMLATATYISTYKPWGKTWFGERKIPTKKGVSLEARAESL